jgi:hypothetical protein
VTGLDLIVLRRAEEQMAGPLPSESAWDGWRIRGPAPGRLGGHYHSRHDPAPKRPCLAGDCARKVNHGGYCSMHWNRVIRGTPVDDENWRITYAEYLRFAKGNPRFGGPIRLGRKP